MRKEITRTHTDTRENFLNDCLLLHFNQKKNVREKSFTNYNTNKKQQQIHDMCVVIIFMLFVMWCDVCNQQPAAIIHLLISIKKWKSNTQPEQSQEKNKNIEKKTNNLMSLFKLIDRCCDLWCCECMWVSAVWMYFVFDGVDVCLIWCCFLFSLKVFLHYFSTIMPTSLF